MEALVVSEFGDVDVLEFQEIDDPTPGPNEVSIDVLYAAVNFADTRMRSGAYYSPIVPPFILGREVVGRVRELGDPAVDLTPGELVAATSVQWRTLSGRTQVRPGCSLGHSFSDHDTASRPKTMMSDGTWS